MARFFQSFEEEKIERKKKTEEIQNEPARQSKKEKKILEIEKAASELNGKGFDKNFKKFMTELKKNQNLFDEIPEFLLRVFEDERVAKMKNNQQLVEDFVSGFVKEEIVSERTVKVEGNNKRKLSLEEILEIKEDSKRKEELEKYEGKDEDEKCCVIVALFSIYSRDEDINSMINILSSYSRLSGGSRNNFRECTDGEGDKEETNKAAKSKYKKIMEKNLDNYIGKVYQKLTPEFFDSYLQLLNSFSTSQLVTDQGNGQGVIDQGVTDQGEDQEISNHSNYNNCVEQRILEFKFFKLSLNPSNDNLYFKLLKFIRDADYKNSKDYFLANFTTADLRHNFSPIVYELGILAYKNSDFVFSFELFNSLDGVENVRKYLYSLCVILSIHKQQFNVLETPAFAQFLDDFKRFDNYLLLQSESDIEEILRAFYLANVYDYDSSRQILQSVTGIEFQWDIKH